jgi:hypothetical protein
MFVTSYSCRPVGKYFLGMFPQTVSTHVRTSPHGVNLQDHRHAKLISLSKHRKTDCNEMLFG